MTKIWQTVDKWVSKKSEKNLLFVLFKGSPIYYKHRRKRYENRIPLRYNDLIMQFYTSAHVIKALFDVLSTIGLRSFIKKL